MKKIFVVALVLVLSLCLFGCAPKEKEASSLPDITVDPTPEATPVVAEKKKETVEAVKLTGDGINIRSEANTDCEILGEGSKGDVFKLMDKTDKDWFKIEYDGEAAFVSTDYAELAQVDAATLNKPADSGNSEDSSSESSGESSEESSDESSQESSGDENDASSKEGDDASSKPVTAGDLRSEEDPQPKKRSESSNS